MATYTSPALISPTTRAKSSDINDVNIATTAAFALLPTNASINSGTISYALDTGTADNYVVTLQMNPSAYTDGLYLCMRPLNTNLTTNPVVNVNGLGQRAIKNKNNEAPEVGDILAGVPLELRFSTATNSFHMIQNSTAAARTSAINAAAALASRNDAVASGIAAGISEVNAAASAAATAIAMTTHETQFHQTLIAATTSATLTLAQQSCNATITNRGATGAVTLTLLAGANGHRFRFEVMEAQELRFTAATGQRFSYQGVNGSVGGSISSSVIGTTGRITWNGATWAVDLFNNSEVIPT